MQLIWKKWLWGVILLLVCLVAATVLLALGKFPGADQVQLKDLALGAASVLSYLLGRKDGSK